jgi:hypothetical protein
MTLGPGACRGIEDGAIADPLHGCAGASDDARGAGVDRADAEQRALRVGATHRDGDAGAETEITCSVAAQTTETRAGRQDRRQHAVAQAGGCDEIVGPCARCDVEQARRARLRGSVAAAPVMRHAVSPGAAHGMR